MSAKRPQVMIVGGGFGGLACAKALRGGDADVLLIDHRNYHLFTPLLYQVATALLNPSDIAFPFRALFRRWKNVNFRQDRIVGIDRLSNTVKTVEGNEIAYDYLVLATGSTDNHFGNEALAEHTISMKTLPEAMQLRNHVLASLEHAERLPAGDERRGWMTFVVVGGGPTGVEYAGALAELLSLTMGRDYPDLARADARVILIEAHERLLGAFPESLSEYARAQVTKRGVEVRTGALVEDADVDHVQLSGGQRIDTHTTVWSAGVRPNDAALGDADLERSRSKRVDVDERFRVDGSTNVFAIGDLASVDEHGQELPMLSPPAMQGGRYVAARINDVIAGGPEALDRAPDFRYKDKGTMATIGRNSAVGVVRGVKFKGFFGWVAWLFVHLYYVIGFRNRLLVLSQWAWDYLRRDRPIRIIASSVGDDVIGDLDE